MVDNQVINKVNYTTLWKSSSFWAINHLVENDVITYDVIAAF